MRNVNRSALVTYSAAEMFALVDDIEAYPQFLPWCGSATVHKRDELIVEATIDIRRAGVHKSFKTRNTLDKNKQIDISLLEGPFSHLSGSWQFQSLAGKGCKITLILEFEFENRLTNFFFGQVFEEISNSLVDAFTRRADVVYATRD